MRLINPAQFAEQYFDPRSAPDLRTIRSWVEKGIVPGRVIDTGARKQVFVDAEAWEEKPLTGNPLADRVLAKAITRAQGAAAVAGRGAR